MELRLCGFSLAALASVAWSQPQPFACVTAGGELGGAEGLRTLLAEHGRTADDITAAVTSGELPLEGVNILLLGSYAVTAPVRATLAQHRDRLERWLAAGGVLVELAQQDSDYPRTDWLPGGLLVGRADTDYDAVTWLRPDHPIATTPNPLTPADLTGWRYRNWGIAWEALTSWDGFENLAACGPRGDCSAFVEAAWGRGRVIVSVISPDTMVVRGEGDTPAKARRYFANLLHYLDELVAGRGVELHPTPRLTEPVGPQLGERRLRVMTRPESALSAALAQLGVGFEMVDAPPRPGEAELLLLDAGRAEALPEDDLAAVRSFAAGGGIVIELYQNQQRRPLWLPDDERAGRGGYPADVLGVGAAGHPLFERPNPLAGSRRAAWREGEAPLARPPLVARVGWGAVALFGDAGAVLERSVGGGRAIVVAADPGAVATRTDLVGDNARAFLANLLQYAADASRGTLPPVPPAVLPERGRMSVGRQVDGSVMVPTEQLLRPAGRQVEFPGRPTDLAMLPDGRTLAVVDRGHLRTIDIATGELRAGAASDGGHAVVGLAVSRDGSTLYTSSVKHLVQVWRVSPDGTVRRDRSLPLPGQNPAPCGLALSADERTIYVCASRSNAVVVLPLEGGEPQTVPVGVAPYDALRLGGKLYVTNWGGRRPAEGDLTANSSGTQVRVDQRTIANDGSVSVIDLESLAVTAEIPVGLLPSGLCASPDGRRVYVANANSDSISVIDTAAERVVGTIEVKPSDRLPFGSGVNDVCSSPDGRTLYAACGTNNAVAVVELDGDAGRVAGFIPVGWYPGAVALDATGSQLFVANTKGVGSLAAAERHNSHQHQGTVSLVPAPAPDELADWTRQTHENNRLSLALAGLEPPRADAPPRPLPERHGEPSLIRHVIYIIRENRTYDQVLGDVAKGNGDPSLVHFGTEVTPNAHALAEEFVLLDNFYCSGVLSADGHQWTDEGYVTSYLEKSFGGFVRSYPYAGDDALAYSPGGFIWDNVLAHGKTFRSYGEMVQARIRALDPAKPPLFRHIYDDFADDGVLQSFEVRATAQIRAVAENLCPTVIGFPINVPDIYRAAEFIRELREFEANGDLPNLCILLLPADHTTGTTPNYPTPRAAVADNDLALGRIVEAVTHSRFWPETAIFVCQDDPQAGVDHVDGHRSPAFVISPYTPRGGVDSSHYTQVGMLKTIELLLGLPPMNQLDLAAEPMRGCFTAERDLTPYVARPNRVPLDELNPPKSALSGAALYWAERSEEQDFDELDEADEDTLNRILWHFCKGYDTPYPQWAATTTER